MTRAGRGGGTLTIAEVEAFADKMKAVLANAEADRRTVEALRALIAGGGGRRRAALLGDEGDEGRGGGRRANAANDGRILEAVRGAKEGVRVGDLIKMLRLNRKALTRALKRLRDTGQVRMSGEKRLARYHAV
jgi:hypothetical protein